MDKRDMLLVLTICELLGSSFEPREVREKYREAVEKLKSENDPIPDAQVVRVPQDY